VRVSLGAAASGTNSDITALLGLTTPLSVTEGGTGAATAGAALAALGGIGPGANSTITSLTGLTTPLTQAQGGTGGTSLGVAMSAASVTPTGGTAATLAALLSGTAPLPGLTVLQPNGHATDIGNVQFTRLANYTGGTTGFVNGALRATDTVSAGTNAYEWTATFIMNNNGVAADNSQNVALYSQSNKIGTGSTWGHVNQLNEIAATANPVNASVVFENSINANGTDTNHNRILMDNIASKQNSGGASPEVDYAFRITNSQEGSTGAYFDHGFGTDTNVPMNYVFDASQAVAIPGNAFLVALNMSPGQIIDLGANQLNFVQYDSGTGKVFIYTNGVKAFSVDQSGNVKAKGTITASTSP